MDGVVYENDFLVIHQTEQGDFHPNDMPFVAHHKYSDKRRYGSRRVAFGKTADEAIFRAIKNILLFPLESDHLLTNEVASSDY
jgi:hypothetical protein